MIKKFTICEKRQGVLDASSHMLVEGGPGCGKTTLALLKARAVIDSGVLKRNQKILFLSFARATISRVEEQASHLLSPAHKKYIEINTYHGFAWSIIQAYGKLAFGQPRLGLITPPQMAAAMATIQENLQEQFKDGLLQQGLVCFDRFASMVVTILTGSKAVREIYSKAFPLIIVDEFQDTDTHEWDIIRLLGQHSQIIALADLNQRIFEFRGASPKRIPVFKTTFRPFSIDLGLENNRSPETDIVKFGDDMLAGTNRLKIYKNVQVNRYPYYKEPKINLKYALLNSIKRLKQQGIDNWSIAILVKRKIDTLSVAAYLDREKISHDVLIDPEGPALAAAVLAHLLQPHLGRPFEEDAFIQRIITHLKGRKGTNPAKKDIEFAAALEGYCSGTKKLSGSLRAKFLSECKQILDARNSIVFTGIPEQDWLNIRGLFQSCTHPTLHDVYEDARFIRLLKRGNILSEKLAAMWRQSLSYQQASVLVEQALVQEHFSMASQQFRGIFVMNMHKCKGKEFDEVIVWEELFKPILWDNADANDIVQHRLLLRVVATRARSNVTFLTPATKPCILL